MVWPFTKKKDVVDWTGYAKKDIVKSQINEEIRDFTGNSAPAPMADAGALGFLGNMAVASESSPNSQLSGNKLDDIEYKLDNLTRRLNAMIDRLDLVEKKIERNVRIGAI